jgi:hypothetical protein
MVDFAAAVDFVAGAVDFVAGAAPAAGTMTAVLILSSKGKFLSR